MGIKIDHPMKQSQKKEKTKEKPSLQLRAIHKFDPQTVDLSVSGESDLPSSPTKVSLSPPPIIK